MKIATEFTCFGRTHIRTETLKEKFVRYRPPARPKSWKKFFNRYLPITDWLFNYDIRKDVSADVITGFTIAIMHIPQGTNYYLDLSHSLILVFLSMKAWPTQVWPRWIPFTDFTQQCFQLSYILCLGLLGMFPWVSIRQVRKGTSSANSYLYILGV